MQLHPATLAFLRAINEHNSRKYFASIRDLYDEVFDTIKDVCDACIVQASTFDNEIKELQAKDCLFRIYRDARRLKEGDQIYKNNFGFAIGVGGKKSTLPGYYFHIQPDNKSFFCAGLYRPTPQQLNNLRTYMKTQGKTYESLIKKQSFKKLFPHIEGASISRPPRGFTIDDPYIDLIMRKQHLIIHYISDEDLLSKDIVKLFTEYLKASHERIDFLMAGCLYNNKTR